MSSLVIREFFLFLQHAPPLNVGCCLKCLSGIPCRLVEQSAYFRSLFCGSFRLHPLLKRNRVFFFIFAVKFWIFLILGFWASNFFLAIFFFNGVLVIFHYFVVQLDSREERLMVMRIGLIMFFGFWKFYMYYGACYVKAYLQQSFDQYRSNYDNSGIFWAQLYTLIVHIITLYLSSLIIIIYEFFCSIIYSMVLNIITVYFHPCSESRLEQVSIQWNIEGFLTFLKFIHGSQLYITSNNFLQILEACLHTSCGSEIFQSNPEKAGYSFPLFIILMSGNIPLTPQNLSFIDPWSFVGSIRGFEIEY